MARLLSTFLLMLCMALPAAAQFAPSVSPMPEPKRQYRFADQAYLRVEFGPNLYRGDRDQTNSGTSSNFAYVGGGIGAELGYSVREHVQIGFTYALHNIPALDEPRRGVALAADLAYRNSTSETRHFFGMRTRVMGYATRPTSPYIQLGATAFGGKRGGVTRFGIYPHLGVGLDYAANPTNSFFAEANFGLLIPDEAIDGVNDQSGNVDLFTIVNVGYTRRLARSMVPVDVLRVEGPMQAETGNTLVYSATVNLDEATGPLDYVWDFGDGTTATGLVARHTYRAPGSYPVRFTAVGPGNDSSEMLTTFVSAPPPREIQPVIATAPPLRIRSAYADPMRVYLGETVRFGFDTDGDAAPSCRWAFGDGFETTSCTPTYTYREPGTYNATLEVANQTGGDAATVEVIVDAYAPPAMQPVAPLDACADVRELDTAFFATGSSLLSFDAQQRLADNATLLAGCPGLHVQIDGFAGPTEYDARELSEARSEAVAQYYVARGISPNRLSAQGRGRVLGVSRKQAGARYQYATTILYR